MLILEDPKWSELQDAYGPAVRIPKLLRQAAQSPASQTKPSDEPWFSLWSSLCHQGTVYTASYAAVPHIAQIAIDNEGQSSLNMNVFLLPASIEIARVKDGPEIPKEIATEYYAALKTLADHAKKYQGSEDIYLKTSARAASLVAEGHIAEAEKLLEGE